MTDHGAGEAGHPLAVLTEALRATNVQLYGEDFLDPEEFTFVSARDHAAAILAHPAMADLARKAAAFPLMLEALHGYDYLDDYLTKSGGRKAVAAKNAAIAAALEQDETGVPPGESQLRET